MGLLRIDRLIAEYIRGAMRISKLKLTNWKNFKSVEMDLLDRVFVVGPNAAGKSNLLDSLRFLRDLVRSGGGLQEAVRDRDGVSKIRCLAARKVSHVTIEVTLSENGQELWRYSLTFDQVTRGIKDFRPRVKNERLEDLSKGTKPIDRPNSQDDQNEDQRLYTYLEQPQSDRKGEYKEVRDFLASISYLHMIPQLIRDPRSFMKGDNKEDYFGRDFLDRVATTNKATRAAYLKRISAVLRAAVPNFDGLDFEKDELGLNHFVASFDQWRGPKAKHQERQFSDGTLRLIGLFWALQEGNKPIILEEPELSLHTGIVQQLAQVVHRLQRGKHGRRQVFISTHSHDLLNDSGIAPEEVFVLEPVKEETKVVAALKYPEVKAMLSAGASVAEALRPRIRPKDLAQLSMEF